MKALVQEKAYAIRLRKKGYSYRDILKEVPVSKSSLSLWLKDLPLTAKEKRSLRKRCDANVARGRIRSAAANKQARIQRQKTIVKAAKQEFSKFKSEHLFQVGIALYWAEGAKRSDMFHFMNSDVDMIKLMLLWLYHYAGLSKQHLGYRLYIHKPYQHEECEHWWAQNLDISDEQFKKTIIKPSGIGVKKRPNYRGCIRVEVPCSTILLRKMKIWQSMLVEEYKKQ